MIDQIRAAIEAAMKALAPLAGMDNASVEINFVSTKGAPIPAWLALLKMGATHRAVLYEHPGQPPHVIESLHLGDYGEVEVRAQQERAPDEGDEISHPGTRHAEDYHTYEVKDAF